MLGRYLVSRSSAETAGNTLNLFVGGSIDPETRDTTGVIRYVCVEDGESNHMCRALGETIVENYPRLQTA